MQCSFYRAPLC